MLTLVEELLLIAIDDDTGKMNMSASGSIHYGLAGAIIMELTLKGCLDYQNKKVVFLDKTETGDELLNESLQYIREKHKGRNRSLQHWVQTLGTHINRKKKQLLYINLLIEKAILKQEETKYLFLFTKDIYPSTKTGIENAIRERVKRSVLLENSEMDKQTLLLIGLLKACNIDKQIFTREEYKIAKKKNYQYHEKYPARKGCFGYHSSDAGRHYY